MENGYLNHDKPSNLMNLEGCSHWQSQKHLPISSSNIFQSFQGEGKTSMPNSFTSTRNSSCTSCGSSLNLVVMLTVFYRKTIPKMLKKSLWSQLTGMQSWGRNLLAISRGEPLAATYFLWFELHNTCLNTSSYIWITCSNLTTASPNMIIMI